MTTAAGEAASSDWGWRWLSLDETAGEPDERHMVFDAELLDRVAAGIAVPSVRTYAWRSPAVTIGRLQDESAVRVQFGAGIPLYRRPTGGRAVLHGDDLTIAVTAPHAALARAIDEFYGGRGVLAEYRLLVAPVRAALAKFGVDTHDGNKSGRSGRTESDEDCFSSAARCDVLDAKRGIKILGSAMRRVAGATLVQMSLRPTPDCDVFAPAFTSELRAQYARYLNIGRWNIAEGRDGIRPAEAGNEPQEDSDLRR